MMTRREALRLAGLGTAALAATPTILTAQPAPAPTGPFKLPPLPYATDALEPHVDARTMEIHHGKHHAAYVANLNKAVADHPTLQQKSIEDLVRNLDAVPESIRTAVRNNGGGHLNHALFWQMMRKDGGGEPKGSLAEAITKNFGSLASFKDSLSKAGLGQFGSGWAWLVLDGKTLKIEASPNQDSPWMAGKPLLLGVDVWEHAYYLKYQNRRADYLAAWMNVVNWDFVNDRYQKALAS
jgi:Fe-Mn family superoxide dismutase